MSDRHDDKLATGRTPRPADSVASTLKTPRFLESATVKLGHAVGGRLDDLSRRRSRQRLRHVGWQHALDVSKAGYARGTFPARDGNRLDVLVDGSEALPVIAAELARAESLCPPHGLVLLARARHVARRRAQDRAQPPRRTCRARRCPLALVEGSAGAALQAVTERCSRDARRARTTHQDRGSR